MDINKAPMISMNNRQILEQSSVCGCFNCLKVFVPSEISLWTDNGKTALCPYCELDMVLPDVNEEILTQVHNYWIPKEKGTDLSAP